MHKLLLIAGVALFAVPSIVSAQPSTAQSGYYDDNGVWHASTGYYDSNGNWVEGAPPAPAAPSAPTGPAYNGYGASGAPADNGYDGYGATGGPAASGYGAPGYNGYNGYGAPGANYGAPGPSANNGYGAPGAPNGYGTPGAPAAGGYGADTAYMGAHGDLGVRENWLGRRIEAGEYNGALSHYDADRDRGRLDSIRDLEGRLRGDHGGLTVDDRAELTARLDDLSSNVKAQWNHGY